ncbi:VOC family protein [Galactobacter caseinivorans]|uniref:VOC family protein n=1 Tax=Galactobacter caseinivorans TaxID=2676123 RepID=A0A496PIU2_9MICC|nr:VOC family protein [Galactobacter caseinivorans]RKW70412.1 VOC family protein [Galactobacter caseinivorans]
MSSRVSHTSIDCTDAFALSEWWRQSLDYEMDPADPNLPGHEECLIHSPVDGHQLLFIEVPEGKGGKNRIHFDLRPTDRSRDQEVDALLERGASVYADLRKPDGTGWVTMQDPEGNEFCVLRSDAELG